MKKLKLALWIVMSLFIAAITFTDGNARPLTPDKMLANVHWLGRQASVKIDAGDKTVYIDPFQIEKESHDADIILITHSHKDHLSPADIAKISNPDTVFIATKSCLERLKKDHKNKIMVSAPGMKTKIGDILITAVPAYNVVKTRFHPKKNNWVGYVLTIDGVRIYHAGDTERIPEMKTFSCDIALLPLGQTYTMNSVEEAAQAARDVKAKIVIPMHYGMYEGTAADAQKFKDLLKGQMRVVIQ